MGRNIEYPDRELRTIQISDFALDYFKSLKNPDAEPYFQVVDRLIIDYMRSDIAKVNKKCERLETLNKIYITKLSDLMKI